MFPAIFIETSIDKKLTRLPGQVLYELGILYDTPAAGDVLPAEQDTDWDIVSEVSEWDLVSLDDSLSDDDSWS